MYDKKNMAKIVFTKILNVYLDSFPVSPIGSNFPISQVLKFLDLKLYSLCKIVHSDICAQIKY